MKPIARHCFIYLALCGCVMFAYSYLSGATGIDREIDQLAGLIGEKITASGKKKIAVVDFTDLQGTVTKLGRFIAEELSVSLASRARGFRVVDRLYLQAVLKDMKFSSNGGLDPMAARKAGTAAGVEALVTGTLTPLGDDVRLNIKVLDTETAVVIGAHRGDIPLTGTIRKLLEADIDSKK